MLTLTGGEPLGLVAKVKLTEQRVVCQLGGHALNSDSST